MITASAEPGVSGTVSIDILALLFLGSGSDTVDTVDRGNYGDQGSENERPDP